MNEELKKNNDDIFSLNFELEVLSGVLLRGELERWVPGFCNLNTEFEHNQRYSWISNFVKNKKVLDIACGTGRGTYLMATIGGAEKVVGCDIDATAVRYASIKHLNQNILFREENAEKFDLREKFDVIVSFETIEHLNNVEDYLNNIKNHLSNDGVYFVSTPISNKDFNDSPDNKYHIQEWGFFNFQKMIEEKFIIDSVYLQLYNKNNKNFFYYIKKIMKRLFVIKNNDINEDRPILSQWDKNKTNAFDCVKNCNGYQILKCRLK